MTHWYESEGYSEPLALSLWSLETPGLPHNSMKSQNASDALQVALELIGSFGLVQEAFCFQSRRACMPPTTVV